MEKQLTLNEILERAIQKEIASKVLYTDLYERVKNVSAKDALQDLAKQEKRHQEFLENYAQGKINDGVLHMSKAIDYKIAECLEQPEIVPSMGLKEIFSLAAKREKASHDLYAGLSSIHPAGQAKHLLDDLAAEELKHKQRVESLYAEVAYPQTDGG